MQLERYEHGAGRAEASEVLDLVLDLIGVHFERLQSFNAGGLAVETPQCLDFFPVPIQLSAQLVHARTEL